MTSIKQTFDDLLHCLNRACAEVYGERLVSLCVFGSVAAGTMRPDSDIDILVVCSSLPRGRTARVEAFDAVENRCRRELRRAEKKGVHTSFSPHLKTPEEVRHGSPIFLDMTDTARILLDRNDFLKRYLEKLKGRLSRLGARRVSFGGGYYWILKPDLEPGEEISL